MKCDERKPSCLRCAKIGRECPGYEHPEKWVFINEQETVSRTARDHYPEKLDEKICAPARSSLETLFVSDESLIRQINGIMVKHPPKTLNDTSFRSVCLFLDNFTQMPAGTQVAFSYMDFLPDLFAKSAEGSALQKAVLAASLRNFANHHHATEITSAANKAYAEALQSTNRAIADSTSKLRDETIVAVHLLSIHELLCPFSIRGTWRVHVQGTLPLLLMRGLQQFTAPRGVQIFRAVHSPILMRALRYGEEPSEAFQRLATEVPLPVSIALQITLYIQKVVVLRSRLLKALDRGAATAVSPQASCDRQRRITCMINEARRIDDLSDIDSWTTYNPLWKIYSIRSCNVLQRHTDCCSAASFTQYYWRSLYVMSNWVRFWVARAYLYETLAKAAAELYNSSSDQDYQKKMLGDIKTFQSSLQGVADSILSAFRFAHGELGCDGKTVKNSRPADVYNASAVGPLLYFYALKAIEDFQFTSAVQRNLARESLIRIGVEKGIGSALMTRWNE